MTYFGRPGLSPANAALVASGVLAPGARILEVGTGDGTEAILLAKLGFEVVGIDAGPIDDAERNAKTRRAKATFRRIDALDLADAFPAASFDAVVDVLAYNNIAFGDQRKRGDEARYVRGVAHVLRDGGVWSVQWRAERALANETPAIQRDLPRVTWSLFEGHRPVWTHVPEYKSMSARTGFAPVGLAVLRRRARSRGEPETQSL